MGVKKGIEFRVNFGAILEMGNFGHTDVVATIKLFNDGIAGMSRAPEEWVVKNEQS